MLGEVVGDGRCLTDDRSQGVSVLVGLYVPVSIVEPVVTADEGELCCVGIVILPDDLVYLGFNIIGWIS